MTKTPSGCNSLYPALFVVVFSLPQISNFALFTSICKNNLQNMKLENPLRLETGKKSIQAKEVYFGLVFQSLGFSPWVSLKDFFFM